jgi:hypothetical protein
LCAICDFNLIEKRVRSHTAIPFHINKLTSQVIDDTLDGSLGETPDQAFVSSDFFRGTTSHAVLTKVDHCERLLPNHARSSRLSTGGSMPRDFFVHDNLSIIFVRLDDRITPTQLGFNMSQLAGNFRFDWITQFERLI